MSSRATPADERAAGEHLFQEDHARHGRHPHQAHRAQKGQHEHQRPAAAQTVDAVNGADSARAQATLPELYGATNASGERKSQAHPLQRCELVGPGQDQQSTSYRSAPSPGGPPRSFQMALGGCRMRPGPHPQGQRQARPPPSAGPGTPGRPRRQPAGHHQTRPARSLPGGSPLGQLGGSQPVRRVVTYHAR